MARCAVMLMTCDSVKEVAAWMIAATPTAAAEILTAGYVEGREWLTRQVDRLRKLLTAICERQSVHVARLDRRLANRPHSY